MLNEYKKEKARIKKFADKWCKDNNYPITRGGFINHSGEPNCHRIQVRIKPGFDKWTITVVKNIKAGEELTLKYTIYVPKSTPNVNGMAYLGGP